MDFSFTRPSLQVGFRDLHLLLYVTHSHTPQSYLGHRSARHVGLLPPTPSATVAAAVLAVAVAAAVAVAEMQESAI